MYHTHPVVDVDYTNKHNNLNVTRMDVNYVKISPNVTDAESILSFLFHKGQVGSYSPYPLFIIGEV